MELSQALAGEGDLVGLFQAAGLAVDFLVAELRDPVALVLGVQRDRRIGDAGIGLTRGHDRLAGPGDRPFARRADALGLSFRSLQQTRRQAERLNVVPGVVQVVVGAEFQLVAATRLGQAILAWRRVRVDDPALVVEIDRADVALTPSSTK